MKVNWKLFALWALTFLLILAQSPLQTSANEKANQGPSDLNGHWSEESVRDWIEQGYINGYNDGSFRPDHDITRAEFLALINRVFNETTPKVELPANPFSDVKESDWYYRDILLSYQTGSINGYPNGEFSPQKEITRVETAVTVSRLLAESNLNDSATLLKQFADYGEVPAWGHDALAMMVNAELLNGYKNNTLRPSENITRAETVVLLNRAKGHLSPQTSTDEDDTNETSGSNGSSNGSNGSGGSSGTGGSNGSGNSGNKEVAVANYKEEVKQLEESVVVTTNMNGEVILSKTAVKTQPLQPGDVLLFEPSERFPQGEAYKITSLIEQGAYLILETSTPTFADIFDSLNIETDTLITPDHFVPAPGVTVEPLPKDFEFQIGDTFQAADISVGIPSFTNGFKVSFTVKEEIGSTGPLEMVNQLDNFLEFNDVTETVSGSASADFTLDSTLYLANPEITADIKFNWGVPDKAQVELTAHQSLDTDITISGKASGSIEYLLGEVKVPVAQTGIIINAPISLVLETSVDGNIEWGFRLDFNQKLGFVSDIDGSNFEPIAEFTRNFTGENPTISGTLTELFGVKAGVFFTLLNIDKLSLGLDDTLGVLNTFSGNFDIDTQELENSLYCPSIESQLINRLRALILEKEVYSKTWELFEIYSYDPCNAIQTLTVKPNELVMKRGEETLLDVRGNSKLADNLDLSQDPNTTYISSDPTVVSVDKKGALSAQNAPDGSAARITVTYENSDGTVKRDIANVTIEGTYTDGILISPMRMTLKPGESKELRVEAFKAFEEEPLDITTDSETSYLSSDFSTVTVNPSGVITATESAKDGSTATVTVQHGDHKRDVEITVFVDLRDVILRAEAAANSTFSEQALLSTPQPFDEVTAGLAQYYTPKYTNKVWEKVYENHIDWFKQPEYLYPYTEAIEVGTDQTFQVTTRNDQFAYAQVHLPTYEEDRNFYPNGFLYLYRLQKINGDWIVDDISAK